MTDTIGNTFKTFHHLYIWRLCRCRQFFGSTLHQYCNCFTKNRVLAFYIQAYSPVVDDKIRHATFIQTLCSHLYKRSPISLFFRIKHPGILHNILLAADITLHQSFDIFLKSFLIKSTLSLFLFPITVCTWIVQRIYFFIHFLFSQCCNKIRPMFIHIYGRLIVNILNIFTEKIPIFTFCQFVLIQCFEIVHANIFRFPALGCQWQHLHIRLNESKLTVTGSILLIHPGISFPLNGPFPFRQQYFEIRSTHYPMNHISLSIKKQQGREGIHPPLFAHRFSFSCTHIHLHIHKVFIEIISYFFQGKDLFWQTLTRYTPIGVAIHKYGLTWFLRLCQCLFPGSVEKTDAGIDSRLFIRRFHLCLYCFQIGCIQADSLGIYSHAP